MCGIAGFYTAQGILDYEALTVMTDAQKHRGPDAAGHFYNERCGLGHRRLSIIDLSNAANQPMYDSTGRYVIVYNGEIYNFQEIAKDLKVPLKTTSDTEVLLEAYVQWGASCVHRLNGMFAFVIYDTHTEELFLCRDRMGIKPLFVYMEAGNLIFSSELKGILALRPRIRLNLNRTAIREYLLLGYVPEPHSLCAEVEKFRAGTYAFFKNGEMKVESFWQPEDKVGKEVLKDEVEAKRQLKELINSSVAYRMISDVPFGTFLSGGIDSSLVTAVAQQNSDKPVNTFSIGFQEGKYNESSYAQEVARNLGTRHHEFTVTHQDALDQVWQMVDAIDEPFADSSLIPTMLVSRLARQHVTMTLSGDGGDELFLGYGSYRWATRLRNPLVRLLRFPIHNMLSRMDNRLKRAANQFAWRDLKTIKSNIFSQEIYYFSHAEIDEIFNGTPEPIELLENPANLGRKLKPREAQSLFDMRYYLRDDLLAKVDRGTMQHSLETRVPLIDYRIVEFALNLDESLKYRKGVSKYLLKQVLFDYLPEQLFNRPKWGFSIPLDHWMETDLHYLIPQYCSIEACEKYGLINGVLLQNYIKEYEAGSKYLYNRLWQVIVLHKTLERTGLS